MRLGDVVVEIKRGHHRGVVIWANGQGLNATGDNLGATGYLIERKLGMYHVTDFPEEFRVVDEAEWTALERVKSKVASWERPDWVGPEESWAEYHTLEWQLLLALLPPHVQADVTANDWPSTCELAVIVARWQDDTIADTRVLGTALGRL